MSYLDANATTAMRRCCIEKIHLYEHAVNVHSASPTAVHIMRKIETFRRAIYRDFGFRTIFTSGATEANAQVVASFAKLHSDGHIIATSGEHPSINSAISATGLPVTHITPPPGKGACNEIVDIINKTPALTTAPVLVCVIHGNNETGLINDVETITRNTKAMCEHTHVHIDCAQTFGKTMYTYALFDAGVDTIAMSFHKIHGVHLGMLLYRDADTDIVPLINGHQQDTLRGGTLPAPLIMSAYCAYKHTMRDRKQRNAKLRALRSSAIHELAHTSGAPITNVGAGSHSRTDFHIAVFGLTSGAMPTTICIVVNDPSGRFCNVRFRQHLAAHGIIISIGSACQTQSKKASHNTDAHALTAIQKRGVLRISFAENTHNFIPAIRFIGKEISRYTR